MEDDTPIAWTAIAQDEKVYSSDGTEVGTVEEVLGTGPTGIFHGLAMKSRHHEGVLEVPAKNVSEITLSRVTLDLNSDQLATLHPFEEEAAFTLGLRGILGKHLAWVEDRKGDR